MRPVELNTKYEIPVYNEFIVKNRDQFVNFLRQNDVQTRNSSPNFERVKYLKTIKNKKGFPNSKEVEENYVYLESGPGLKKKRIDEILKIINLFYKKNAK